MRRFILFIPGRRLTLSEFSSSGFVCVCVSVDADVLFLLVLAGVYVYFCVCVCVLCRKSKNLVLSAKISLAHLIAITLAYRVSYVHSSFCLSLIE